MELQQVRILVAVAEHRSFTRAAAALHVTQSSLSHSIAKLETEIGLRLFHRTRHGAVLTSDGETLLVPARRILQDFDLFDEAVSGILGTTVGHLRLVYSQTISVSTGEIISEFARRYAGIRMQISAPRDDADIFHLVETGVCDVGLARIDEALPGVDTETIATETLVLLLPQAWDSDPTRTDLPWDELSDVPLIVPPAGSASRNRLDRFSNQIGITVNAFLENENRWMSIEMVRSGVAAFLASQASEITIPGVVQKRLVPTEPARSASSLDPVCSPRRLPHSPRWHGTGAEAEPTVDGDSPHRFRLCHFVFPGYRGSTPSWKSACAIVSAPVMSELTSTMVVGEQRGTSKASTEAGSDACCTRVSRSSSLIEGSSESVIFFWKSAGTPPGYREVFTYSPSSVDGAVARTLRSIGAAGSSATSTRVDLLSRCHTII